MKKSGAVDAIKAAKGKTQNPDLHKYLDMFGHNLTAQPGNLAHPNRKDSLHSFLAILIIIIIPFKTRNPNLRWSIMKKPLRRQFWIR